MKKKIFGILVCCILVLGMTGCGNESKEENNSSLNNSSQTNKEEQKQDNNQQPTGNYVYMIETTQRMRIGNVPSKYGTVYSTPEEAMQKLGKDIVIRHTIEDEEIKESYVGFKLNGKMYYLKGSDTSIYEENKKVLKDLFGKSNINDTTKDYSCNNEYVVFITRTYVSAEVRAYNMYCISYDNFSKCGTQG